MIEQFSRTEILLGEAAMERLYGRLTKQGG
jgi:hypothetical protein